MSFIKVDVRDDLTPLFAQLGEGREVKNALRRAVDKSARAARREAIPIIAKDIGVSADRIKAATPLVRPSTQSNISASWTVRKMRTGLYSLGKFSPEKSWNRGSFQGATFRVTGGGSSKLSIAKAFTLGRAPVLMIRVGKGRSAIKAVYAAHPATTMAQGDGAPRLMWERTASKLLSELTATELQRAFAGQRGGSHGQD